MLHSIELKTKYNKNIIKSYHAIGMKWRDGSFKTDIPSKFNFLFHNYLIEKEHYINFLM